LIASRGTTPAEGLAVFWRRKIRIARDLYDRAVRRAAELGLPSVAAYLGGLLERDLKEADEQALREKVLRQMKGLGYLQ
jgi:hypothetical protein